MFAGVGQSAADDDALDIDDVVAASRAREVHMRAPGACGTDQEEVERIVAALH